MTVLLEYIILYYNYYIDTGLGKCLAAVLLEP